MTKEIDQFLQAGKTFRIMQLGENKGDILLISPIFSILRNIIGRWSLLMQTPLICTETIEDAMEILEVGIPKCVIFDIVEEEINKVESFLEHIDTKYPAMVTIAIVGCPETGRKIQNNIPRLTVISKGDGLKDFLLSIIPKQSRLVKVVSE